LTTRDVNRAYETAAEGSLKGILAVSHEPLVSVDYKKDAHSATIDGLSTGASGRMVRVVAWYDNEWAYSMRLIDTFHWIDRSQMAPEVLPGAI
jgi:glyceraldehyde 3-phosphate dehydrogenase